MIALDRPIETGHRVPMLPKVLHGNAPVAVRLRIVGHQGNSAIKTADRILVLPQVDQREAEIEVGDRMMLVLGYCLSGCIDGLLSAPRMQVQMAQEQQRIEMPGLRLQYFPVDIFCTIKSSLLMHINRQPKLCGRILSWMRLMIAAM